MRAASLILVILGGVASAGALVWLWIVGAHRTATLQAERVALLDASEKGEEPPLPADRLTTWGNVLTTRQDTELAIIANATTAAKGPLALIVAGIIASTVGGVLSLFI